MCCLFVQNIFNTTPQTNILLKLADIAIQILSFLYQWSSIITSGSSKNNAVLLQMPSTLSMALHLECKNDIIIIAKLLYGATNRW